MCDVCEYKHRSTRSYYIVIVVLFVIIGVLGTLVARMDHILNNAYDLSRNNHVIACHIDSTLNSGQKIYQCQDVPTKGGSK